MPKFKSWWGNNGNWDDQKNCDRYYRIAKTCCNADKPAFVSRLFVSLEVIIYLKNTIDLANTNYSITSSHAWIPQQRVGWRSQYPIQQCLQKAKQQNINWIPIHNCNIQQYPPCFVYSMFRRAISLPTRGLSTPSSDVNLSLVRSALKW